MGSKSIAIAVALLLVAGVAHAEPSAAEKETARGLMSEGRARRDRADLRGALESFRAADAIMHVPTTGVEVARTQVALGQLVEAADMLRAVLRSPQAANEPAPFVAARAVAQETLDGVEPRIPSIKVITGRGAAVTIDGIALPAAAIGEPFKVDPGHHVVRATRGDATAQSEIDVAERDAKSVSLDPASAPGGAVAAQSENATDAEPAASSDDVGPHRSHVMRTVAWTGVAVAGVGVVVGSIAGLSSLSHTSDAKASCNGDRCSPAAQPDLDAARTTATISTIGFVVAGAGAAAAVIGFVVGDKSDAPRAGRIEPLVGPGSIGARVRF